MEKQENFIQYLDERTSVVQKHTVELIQDNRRDEADFEKIKTNIFQIAKTIFGASKRISGNEEEQLKFFSARLADIEKTWKEALAKAAEHNDEVRILQEQVKLEVMEEVRNTFEQIWGTMI